MSSANSASEVVRRHLQNVRAAFLHLHKALLDSERVQYEQQYGRIPNSGEFFRLVLGHEWFNWLRPMSQFIVQIDETLSAKEPVTLDQVHGFLDTARQLVHPAEHGTIPEQRYFQAIQRDPDIAILHVQMAELLSEGGQI